MPVLFFEGFNSSDSDLIKLDPNYWSCSDNTKLSFTSGRTDNQAVIANRPVGSGISINTTLTLSNFTDPLIDHNCFGIGFYNGEYNIRTDRNDSPLPFTENLISFYDNNREVLRLDIIRTSFNSTNSLGLGVYQNGSLITTYDFKNFAGYSWGILDPYNNLGTSGCAITNTSYLEIYVDAKQNNQMAVRFSANNTLDAPLLNSSNNVYTSISGFNNLSGVLFYSLGGGKVGNQIPSAYQRRIDDLYITGGNSMSGCLLGNNTRVYRRHPDGNGTTQQWFGLSNGSVTTPTFSFVDDNDGDNGLIFSSTSGNTCIYNLANIIEPAPSGIGGIKLTNVARTANIDGSMSFINIMTTGNNSTPIEFGNQYTVDSTTYAYKNSFVFTNPVTGSGWTKQNINDMQIGVRLK